LDDKEIGMISGGEKSGGWRREAGGGRRESRETMKERCGRGNGSERIGIAALHVGGRGVDGKTLLKSSGTT
jgi:hypothetical protein